MDELTYKALLLDTEQALLRVSGRNNAIVGERDLCVRLLQDLGDLRDRVSVMAPWVGPGALAGQGQLQRSFDTVVVASDRDKEAILRELLTIVRGTPQVVLGGYEHFLYRDPSYVSIVNSLNEPSLANGYPECRVHLFECLNNAARLGLHGAIAEFGMFRGGTTEFLALSCRHLGVNYPIFGFDTFEGFPPARHLFDMYSHPDLSTVDLAQVSKRFTGFDVTIIPGDIVETAQDVIGSMPLVLAFVDTDNYTSGRAAISAVQDNVVIGGAIVLDHYAGVDRFKQTLGERMAAQDLLVTDARYFNLHGTGVFIRQK